MTEGVLHGTVSGWPASMGAANVAANVAAASMRAGAAGALVPLTAGTPPGQVASGRWWAVMAPGRWWAVMASVRWWAMMASGRWWAMMTDATAAAVVGAVVCGALAALRTGHPDEVIEARPGAGVVQLEVPSVAHAERTSAAGTRGAVLAVTRRGALGAAAAAAAAEGVAAAAPVAATAAVAAAAVLLFAADAAWPSHPAGAADAAANVEPVGHKWSVRGVVLYKVPGCSLTYWMEFNELSKQTILSTRCYMNDHSPILQLYSWIRNSWLNFYAWSSKFARY